MMDLQKVVAEFTDYELDPGKIGTKKLLSELLNIKQSLDLSSMEKTRAINSFLSSMFQIVGTKAGMCHYWEAVLQDSLKTKKLEVKLSLDRATLSKEEVTDYIESNEEVSKIGALLNIASASRFFWSHLLEVLHEVAKRVDSASMSLGVESKLKGI